MWYPVLSSDLNVRETRDAPDHELVDIKLCLYLKIGADRRQPVRNRQTHIKVQSTGEERKKMNVY